MVFRLFGLGSVFRFFGDLGDGTDLVRSVFSAKPLGPTPRRRTTHRGTLVGLDSPGNEVKTRSEEGTRRA